MNKELFTFTVSLQMEGAEPNLLPMMKSFKDDFPKDLPWDDQSGGQSIIIQLRKKNLDASVVADLIKKNAIVLDAHDRYHVDLFKISRNEDELSLWSRANAPCISFPELYPLIELTHIVKDAADLDIVNNITSFTPLKLSAIKGMFKDYGDHYKEYLHVTVRSGKLEFGTSENPKDDTLYSLPLIRAIVSNHALDDDALFSFAEVKLHTVNTIFFKVEENNNLIGNFDFSRRPPKSTLRKVL
jgi:hypothetical protein